jgi:hypothetical protein
MAEPTFNITPRVGVNNVRFGMLRREVRQLIGQAQASRRRSMQLPADDVYSDHSAFFHYDRNDRLEAVEFATKAELSIDRYRITGLSYEDLKLQMLEWDPSAWLSPDAITSEALGIIATKQPGTEAYGSVFAHRDKQPKSAL